MRPFKTKCSLLHSQFGSLSLFSISCGGDYSQHFFCCWHRCFFDIDMFFWHRYGGFRHRCFFSSRTTFFFSDLYFFSYHFSRTIFSDRYSVWRYVEKMALVAILPLQTLHYQNRVVDIFPLHAWLLFRTQNGRFIQCCIGVEKSSWKAFHHVRLIIRILKMYGFLYIRCLVTELRAKCKKVIDLWL